MVSTLIRWANQLANKQSVSEGEKSFCFFNWIQILPQFPTRNPIRNQAGPEFFLSFISLLLMREHVGVAGAEGEVVNPETPEAVLG